LFDFNSVVGISWIVFLVYWLVSARRFRSETKRKEPFSSRLRWWILLILSLFLLFSGEGALGPLSRRLLLDNMAVKLIGVIIMFLGLGFAVWARVHLGQYWSGRVSIKVDHRLIQTGPYGLVRHPIYTGILVGFIGTAVVTGKVRACLAIVLILVGIFLKIRTEDRFLLEEFGSTYLQYIFETRSQEKQSLIPRGTIFSTPRYPV
jgi:protein-S-isoprenylcysteine O-methyltransferase Ste14